MNLQTINEILKNTENIPNCKLLKVVKDETPSDYWEEKSQGSNSSKVITYSIDGESEILLQVTTNCDSYGDTETLEKIEFVRAYEVSL